MMTPDNQAGRYTEEVMAKVIQRDPNLPTDSYNRVYEAVYEWLSEFEFPAADAEGAEP